MLGAALPSSILSSNLTRRGFCACGWRHQSPSPDHCCRNNQHLCRGLTLLSCFVQRLLLPGHTRVQHWQHMECSFWEQPPLGRLHSWENGFGLGHKAGYMDEKCTFLSVCQQGGELSCKQQHSKRWGAVRGSDRVYFSFSQHTRFFLGFTVFLNCLSAVNTPTELLAPAQDTLSERHLQPQQS